MFSVLKQDTALVEFWTKLSHSAWAPRRCPEQLELAQGDTLGQP